jgi:hypothetical protein
MTVISSRQRGSGPAKAAATLAIACAAVAASSPAWAVLGEPLSAASAHADTATLTQRAAYTVSTVTLETGTVVNEYAAPGGKVFAVSWRGPMPPDLTQLLGSYYTDYQTALAARQPGQHTRHLQLNSGRMMFEAGGHMRALRGSAYVPALVPQGLSLGELN